MIVQTEAIHFSADHKLLKAIEQKLRKLEKFFDKILDVHVSLKLESAGIFKNKIAEIKFYIPNGIIFIKECSKTFEDAIDLAIITLKHQLILRQKNTRILPG